jgi:hypothetical protein
MHNSESNHFLNVISFFLVTVVLIVGFSYGSFGKILQPDALKTPIASADATHEASGFAWSSNIGWISFNCLDSSGWSSPQQSTCGVANYGVDVETAAGPNQGNFSGYAWSSNIGWIRFDPDADASGTGCTAAPCAAKLNLDGTVTGWARACSVLSSADCSGSTMKANSITGGWDGWIKMSGSWSNGVHLDADGPDNIAGNADDYTRLVGFAWGGDVVGWVDFAPALANAGVLLNIDPDVTLSANPVSTTFDGSSDLTWTVFGGATDCTPYATALGQTIANATNGWESPATKDVSGGTEAVNNLQASTRFTIECNKPGHPSDWAEVTVVPDAPFDITATPPCFPANYTACGGGSPDRVNIGLIKKFTSTIKVVPIGLFANTVDLRVSSFKNAAGVELMSGGVVPNISFTFTPSSLTSAQYASGSKLEIQFGNVSTVSPIYTATIEGSFAGLTKTATVKIYTTGAGGVPNINIREVGGDN